MIDTDESLLERVRDVDAHDAWKLFFDQYWNAIMAYSRKLGLDGHEAEEVLQETMVTLMRILPEFRYDRGKGRFRNFLLTIVHRKSLAALRRRKRERDSHVPWTSDDGHGAKSLFGSTGDEPVPGDADVQRWKESLLEAALAVVARDARLGSETMAVYRAYVIEGRPAATVAAEFGLKENAVYQIKNRLSRRVQDLVARYLRDSDTGPL